VCSNRPERYLFGNDLAKTVSSSKLEEKIMAYKHTFSVRYSPYHQQLRKHFYSASGGQLFLPKTSFINKLGRPDPIRTRDFRNLANNEFKDEPISII